MSLTQAQTQGTAAAIAQLAELMGRYPCYAFVANAERTGAKAMFRGVWAWADVAKHLAAEPTMTVVADERASGFVRYRLYGKVDGVPGCLAEVELYFNRGEGRTTFWCHTDAAAGAVRMAA